MPELSPTAQFSDILLSLGLLPSHPNPQKS